MISRKALNSLGSIKLKIIGHSKNIRSVSFTSKIKIQKYKNENNRNTFLGYSLLIIPVLTFYLGTWQIQRRKWKLSLLEDIQNKFNLEPIDLLTNLYNLKNMDYIPVKLKGTYLHNQELIVGPRSLITDNMKLSEKSKALLSTSVQRGYNVITPFQLENKKLTVLINRGWVPEQYKDPANRLSSQIEGVQEIIGTVRLSERKPTFVPKNEPNKNVWYYRNVEEIADLLSTAPVFLDLRFDESGKLGNQIISGQTKVSLRNEHLSYALTWFSLSVTTGFLWYKFFINKIPFV